MPFKLKEGGVTKWQKVLQVRGTSTCKGPGIKRLDKFVHKHNSAG